MATLAKNRNLAMVSQLGKRPQPSEYSAGPSTKRARTSERGQPSEAQLAGSVHVVSIFCESLLLRDTQYTYYRILNLKDYCLCPQLVKMLNTISSKMSYI